MESLATPNFCYCCFYSFITLSVCLAVDDSTPSGGSVGKTASKNVSSRNLETREYVLAYIVEQIENFTIRCDVILRLSLRNANNNIRHAGALRGAIIVHQLLVVTCTLISSFVTFRLEQNLLILRHSCVMQCFVSLDT